MSANVTDAGQALLSFGVNAEEVSKHIKTIGDVAAGTRVPIQEMANIFGKGIAKGKIPG